MKTTKGSGIFTTVAMLTHPQATDAIVLNHYFYFAGEFLVGPLMVLRTTESE